jgi:hypothetical protein
MNEAPKGIEAIFLPKNSDGILASILRLTSPEFFKQNDNLELDLL